MKYTHFDDITPNNRTEFAMLYFAAMRTMRKLETAIRKTNDGHLTGRQAGLLFHIQRKLPKMVAAWKSQQNKYKEQIKCPLRDMCYRYRAIPDKYQAYAIFEPKLTTAESNGAACDSFWNCKGYKLRPTEEINKKHRLMRHPPLIKCLDLYQSFFLKSSQGKDLD